MVFEGSDVPLEEDILKKKVEFSTSWIEWAAQNFEQVFQKTTASSGTFFTTPERKTLYITSAWIAYSDLAVGTTSNSEYVLSIGSAGTATSSFLSLSKPNVNGDNGAISINFPMPIKVESNQVVRLTGGTSAAHQVTAGFIGFFVDKRIS